MADNTKDGSAAAAPAKKKSKKGLIMGLVGLLLVGGVGAGGFMMGKGKAPAADEAKPAGEKVEDELAADAKGGKAEAKPAAGAHGEAAKPAAGAEGAAAAAPAHGAAAGAEGAATAEGATGNEPLIYEFEKAFTVNLLDPAGRQFVQTVIQLEAGSAEGLTEIELHKAPLRDATINLLSSKTREDIQQPGGTDRVKRELLARYEGILASNTVQNIYITELVLMRQ